MGSKKTWQALYSSPATLTVTVAMLAQSLRGTRGLIFRKLMPTCDQLKGDQESFEGREDRRIDCILLGHRRADNLSNHHVVVIRYAGNPKPLGLVALKWWTIHIRFLSALFPVDCRGISAVWAHSQVNEGNKLCRLRRSVSTILLPCTDWSTTIRPKCKACKDESLNFQTSNFRTRVEVLPMRLTLNFALRQLKNLLLLKDCVLDSCYPTSCLVVGRDI
jgi:hypothetical protein